MIGLPNRAIKTHKDAKEAWNELSNREKQEYVNQGLNYLDYFRDVVDSGSKVAKENTKSPFYKKLNNLEDSGLLALRKTRNLFHQKQTKTITQESIPTSEQGGDGDFRIVSNSAGVSLYVKVKGSWVLISGGLVGGGSSGGFFNTGLGGGVGSSSSSTMRGDGAFNNTFRAGVTNPKANAVRGLGQIYSKNEQTVQLTYDSGWVAATKLTNVVFTHNLNLREPPADLVVWASNDATPLIGTDTIVRCDYMDTNSGILVSLTTNNTLTLHVGAKVYEGNAMGGSRPADITNGYVRVFLKK